MISVEQFFESPVCEKEINSIASYVKMINTMNENSKKSDKLATAIKYSGNDTILQKLIAAGVYSNPKLKSQISVGDHKAFEKYMENKFNPKSKLMIPSGGILEVLRMLVTREVTGDAAMHLVCSYLSIYLLRRKGKPDLLNIVKPYILDLLALDIGGRMKKCDLYDKYIVDHKQYIDSLAGDNITFKITPELGQKFDEKLFSKGGFQYVSRKLDGVRCFAILDKKENKVTLKSRQNKVFTQFPQIRELLESKLGDIKESIILDGEIVYMDANNIEDFSKIQTLSKLKNADVKQTEECIYYIFGYLHAEEMVTQKFTTKFSQSIVLLDMFERQVLGVNKYIKALPQYPITQLTDMKAEVESNGYEGLMIKKDDVYQPKRTNNLLKVKIMEDGEYKVTGVNIGPFNVQIAGGSAFQKPNMMLALIVDYKNNKVAVGSGFTLAQREEWGAKPEGIIGKTIKIRYKEETSDAKTGLPSLRFPIYHSVL
jgi:DNA ligase-1